MDHKPISWDEVPVVITKEQLWKLCHISKNTARILLQSGKIPCIYSGGKTRCYKILKKDAITYIANRDVFPEYYAVSDGSYATSSRHRISSARIREIKEDMHDYFAYLLRKYPDVLGNEMISSITGYSKTAINNWCKEGYLRHFVVKSRNIQLSRPILVIANLGRWNGHFPGYKEITSGNIRDCLYSDTDYSTWYVDKLGDLRCDAVHHDGTNHYLYRTYKDGVSDEQINRLKKKIYNGIATRTDITRLTNRLGDEIGKVYGWKFPTRQLQKQQER